jgi:riboflavin synthase
MFTGIVETVGRIVGRRPVGDGIDLEIEAPDVSGELRPGQSVALGGICLTVTRAGDRRFAVTAVGETVRRTTVGALRAGARLNIERGLCLGGRLDGHLVQGHVDGVGRVVTLRRSHPGATLRVALDRTLMRFVAPKGSIAVDGVSLTVVETFDDGFTVALVPHTLQVTTLGELAPGRPVNIEVDLLARYVDRLVQQEGIAGGEDSVSRRHGDVPLR